MLDVRFIASVVERDIDLVVMEELSVSDEFRDWFSSRVYSTPVFQSAIGVWHSVVDGALGESDIVYVFTSQAGQRIALLIENKIDAPPQTQQGERYRLRGDKGVRDGYWDEFKTCVIAPERYLTSSKHSQEYDSEISYEELLAFFSSRRFRDCRYLYKARIIQEAVEQNRRGYQPEYSEEMTSFVRNYYDLAARDFPHFGIQEPKPRPSGSTWVMFNPIGYPNGIRLCHQLTSGNVKLFFNLQADNIENLRQRYQSFIIDNVNISLAGKSVALTIEVPKINPLECVFDTEHQKISEALKALSILDDIVRRVENISQVAQPRSLPLDA